MVCLPNIWLESSHAFGIIALSVLNLDFSFVIPGDFRVCVTNL